MKRRYHKRRLTYAERVERAQRKERDRGIGLIVFCWLGLFPLILFCEFFL